MVIQKSHYEEAIADYSNVKDAIVLLRQFRPYLEMIPSMRRPNESIIAIPLPIVRLRGAVSSTGTINAASSETLCLPCDVAILMCDPEWKIKTGVEVFIFIHRPQEDFSDLLNRWRTTQVYLSRDYEWDMPVRYRHILSEGAAGAYPLFVLFEETPDRVKRGLRGAFLPFVTRSTPATGFEETPETTVTATEQLWSNNFEEPLQ